VYQLLGHSITYRFAVGPQAGRKVAEFSLQAGVEAKAHERNKLERPCRYISRSAVSEKRLSLTSSGKVCYELKTSYHNGTNHVFFKPLDIITT